MRVGGDCSVIDRDEHGLDFDGVLAELDAMVGRRVSVESGPGETGSFHESRGMLGSPIDFDRTGIGSASRERRVAFLLGEGEAQVVIRERGLVRAEVYVLELAEGISRAVQMHYAGAVLIVREDPA
jgi:hypothetical protein